MQAAEPGEKKGKGLLTRTRSSITWASGNDTGLGSVLIKSWAPCLSKYLPHQTSLVNLAKQHLRFFAFLYVGWHGN